MAQNKAVNLAYRAYDRYKDFKLGVHTCGLSKKLAPTPYYILNDVFKLIKKQAPEATAFVDYGCGNGRTLVQAYKNSFQTVVGVEIDPELYKTCQKNTTDLGIELHCDSAENIELPMSPSVHYFFHPFDWEIMEKVLAKIKSQALVAGPQWLVLVNPAYYENILEMGFKPEASIKKNTHLYETRLLVTFEFEN